MLFRIISFFVICFLFSTSGFSQEESIILTNSSFEGFPSAARPPKAWLDCNKFGETPPDTHPSGAFGVQQMAQDKNTFMGMVVRDNDTFESVSQRLNKPLRGGQCYAFSIFLARSQHYVSQSRVTGESANYTAPIVLRIWGGDKYCSKKELLAVSDLVINHNWKENPFKFEPEQQHTHITFEAFYKTPILFPYNGNVLIDNASPIVPMMCKEEDLLAVIKPERLKLDPTINVNTSPIASNEPKKDPKPTKPKKEPKPKDIPDTYEKPSTVITTPDPDPVVIPDQVVVEEKIMGELDREKIKEGQTIPIDKLYFPADSTSFAEDSYTVLEEIYRFLRDNPGVEVELGGHTNDRCDDVYCNKLSEIRAKAVADFLEERGISRFRLSHKGYGKTKPIASNKTRENRKKNQRVEIKIIRIK